MSKGHAVRVLAMGSVLGALAAGPALAGNDDNLGCPEDWAIQSVAGSTAGHDRFDRNGDGLICSKGNESVAGNAGPPNGEGNSHVGSPGTTGHNHKDNNNPS